MDLNSNRVNKLIFIILLFLAFTSCEKEVQWTFEPTDKHIIVDGLLTNVKKSHLIRITNSVTELNEVPKPVSGAFVTIYNGDTVQILTEFPENSGIYKTDSNYRAVLNKVYSLQILFEGKRYTSIARMVPVTPFNKLSYTYNSNNNMYYIDSVAKNFSSKESAMYEIIIDWSHLPDYTDLPFTEKRAVLYYYTLKTIDVSQVFAPEKETVYFPLGSRILERKFSLAPQHAQFVRSLLSETEWRGGFFDVTQANVRTNISNGGLGFFGVSTVIRDTLTVR
ncbi:MAG: hypothetical protein DRI95_06620 [Bacteroidetes bacterium]|nr:MAG: hypothetical protein DRI95_06620 [Bacteroidota bacterium]